MKKFNKDKYLRKLKIKRFFRNNSRYFYIVLSCLLCCFLGIYFTYSKFFISDEQAVIRTTVGDFTRGDIVLSVYVDGKKVSEAPKKNAGYIFKNANCDNDATFIWTNSNWKFLVSNITKKTKCSIYFEPGEIYEFAYTGAEQEFIAKKAGTYKIETWGAQGGSKSIYVGGYGGYSTGKIKLNIGQKLYINVGGMGSSDLTTTNVGGYNGGGYSGNNSEQKSFGGGGASHVANVSGTLASIGSSKLSNVLIVAAGGGGATTGSTTQGGSGGGYVGVTGSASDSQWNTSKYIPGGGTQTGAGTAFGGSARQGKFGSGQTSTTSGWGGGGGGGLYGGSNGHGTTGAGGSGYIGNSLLNNKIMYCYNCQESNDEDNKTISTTCSAELPTENCAKKGNGYVIITLENEVEQKLYDYTGEEQTFIATTPGYYKIETWGAEGGSISSKGGAGAYSSGYISLNKGDKLYVNVGGTTEDDTGGYNGGGSITNNKYGGGGATHIAKITGLLSSLENDKDDLLIVAAGGGGEGGEGNSYSGGAGGGISGNNGNGDDPGKGGTQSSGGAAGKLGSNAGTFGKGSSGDWHSESLGGGGGGYYGGSSGGGSYNNGSGGGGSSYIGNSLLSDKAMYCYNCTESSETDTKTISTTCSEETPTENCAKKGNGYARITYIPIKIEYYIGNVK